MRMGRLRIALISGLGLALLAAAGIAVHQSRRLAEVRQQRDTALQSLQETREALRQSQLRLAAALHKPLAHPNNDKAVIARRDAAIQQLNGQISADQASITQLQDKLTAAIGQNAKALASAQKHSQEAEAGLQSQLDALQKELSSALTQVENSQQQVAKLQKANAHLKREHNSASIRTAEREHILNSLQDLDRRRETYLRSISDRYRNITNQFRTMSGMLDSNRGQDSKAFSGAALDLIQNTISLTDNDLQHLTQLNAQAFRLEKKLAKM